MPFELEERFDFRFLEAGRDRRRRIDIDKDGRSASRLRTLVTRAAAGDEELVSAGDQIAGNPNRKQRHEHAEPSSHAHSRLHFPPAGAYHRIRGAATRGAA